jgi:large subunit ribosomal protein L21
MFAVVQLGGQQYKVAEGDRVEVDRMDKSEGKDIKLDQVMLLADGKDIQIGQPYLKDVNVTAKVIRHYLADKGMAFKYRKRKNYAKKKGHRRQLTELAITSIVAK